MVTETEAKIKKILLDAGFKPTNEEVEQVAYYQDKYRDLRPEEIYMIIKHSSDLNLKNLNLKETAELLRAKSYSKNEAIKVMREQFSKPFYKSKGIGNITFGFDEHIRRAVDEAYKDFKESPERNLKFKRYSPEKYLFGDEQKPKPSIEGFVWHGHFEGSEETAYLGKHHPQFPKWRKGVPGATVRIWGPYADISVTTDDRGHYEIYNLPPGEYHMMAERRVKPEKIQAGEYIAEGAEGGYLSQYVDKVVIPPPPDTAHQNFELKPLEEMSHKVSFTGGTRETRERIRKIFAHYKRIRFDRDKLDRRLRALVKAGVVPEENAKYIRQMFDYDLNEAKREMLKWEMERLKEKDNSLDVRSVRYVPSAIGKVNIFSDMTGNLKSNIKKSAGFLFAGVVASAVVGSPLFFFAFICFLISSILPTPNNYSKIRDRIEKINEYYENLKKSEKYSKAGADVEAQIEEQRKNDTMITISMLRDFRMESVAWSTGFKHLLHVAGFALLSLAFVLSSIPLAKPIGVIAALIAYASIKFQRTDTGVHEGGRARWLSRIISQDEV